MVILDLSYMDSIELCETGSKQKIQNENICLQRESNQIPLVFQAGALDHWAMLTVNEM